MLLLLLLRVVLFDERVELVVAGESEHAEEEVDAETPRGRRVGAVGVGVELLVESVDLDQIVSVVGVRQLGVDLGARGAQRDHVEAREPARLAVTAVGAHAVVGLGQQLASERVQRVHTATFLLMLLLLLWLRLVDTRRENGATNWVQVEAFGRQRWWQMTATAAAV